MTHLFLCKGTSLQQLRSCVSLYGDQQKLLCRSRVLVICNLGEIPCAEKVRKIIPCQFASAFEPGHRSYTPSELAHFRCVQSLRIGSLGFGIVVFHFRSSRLTCTHTALIRNNRKRVV